MTEEYTDMPSVTGIADEQSIEESSAADPKASLAATSIDSSQSDSSQPGVSNQSGNVSSTSSTTDGWIGGISFSTEFYNPVMANDFMGDPYIANYSGNYYYTESTGTGIVIRNSKTLSGLLATTNDGKTIWQGKSNNLSLIWAPEIHFVNGVWYAYFAGSNNGATVNGSIPKDKNLVHRMYVLKSRTSDPMGEWDFIGKLELPEDQWAIDGTLFQNDDGKLYFIWSGWKDFSEGPNVWKQNLYICELSDPVTVKSDTSRVQICESAYNWEKAVLPQIEGPVILKTPNGNIKCVYSASYSGSNNYALGELTLNGDPMNSSSWSKRSTPILKSDAANNVYSPGHCSFTTSPDQNEIWIIYHAAKQKDAGWDRSARIQKVEFDSSGNIVMDGALNTNQSYLIPSGETVDRRLYEIESGILTNTSTVFYNDAHGGTAVKLLGSDSKIDLNVTPPSSGTYIVYVRYTNPFNYTKNLYITLNNGKDYKVSIKKCGGEGQFAMMACKVSLTDGDNSLSFWGNQGIALDAVIFEKAS